MRKTNLKLNEIRVGSIISREAPFSPYEEFEIKKIEVTTWGKETTIMNIKTKEESSISGTSFQLMFDLVKF